MLMCDQSSISSSPRSRDTSLPALHTIQQVAPRSLSDRPRKPRLEHQRIGHHATPRGAAIWWSVQKLREWINLSSRHTIKVLTSLIYLLKRYSASNNVKSGEEIIIGSKKSVAILVCKIVCSNQRIFDTLR